VFEWIFCEECVVVVVVVYDIGVGCFVFVGDEYWLWGVFVGGCISG